MKSNAVKLASLIMLSGVLATAALAQEKSKSDEKRPEIQTTPVKIQIVVTEYEGDKKAKSLPYVLYANAPNLPEIKGGMGNSRLRIGSRVPVYAGKNEMQYLDLGTNIDASTAYPTEGQLLLKLNLERSWAEGDVPVPITRLDGAGGDSASGHFPEPLIRNFRSDLDLKLHEGQTVESLVATDPISGRVAKVEVSFVTVK